MTVPGKKALLGELFLAGRPIKGKESKISANVADIGSRNYNVIIGTDLLQKKKDVI